MFPAMRRRAPAPWAARARLSAAGHARSRPRSAGPSIGVPPLGLGIVSMGGGVIMIETKGCAAPYRRTHALMRLLGMTAQRGAS